MSALKTPHSRSVLLRLTVMAAAMLLVACSKPTPQADDVRPVRALVVQDVQADVSVEFPGVVQARYASQLAFRVGGKIVARKVDIGAIVKKGQVLMQLDPLDLRLAQAQSNAALRSAQTALDLARSDLQRYQELRQKNFVSQSVLDSKDSTFKSAQANVESAVASFSSQSNQANYSVLVADVDGVVTAVDAEVGQVVAAGTPVVSVAKAGDKEVLIGLPEDKVAALSQVPDVTVQLWAHPDVPIAGKVREIAPAADPATRTYAVKVAIPDDATEASLGMTALVRFVSKTPQALVRLPLTALYHDQTQTAVWLVEHGTVRLVPVALATTNGNDVLLSAGVKAGQTVVTAGVNLLKPGQKVTILGQELAKEAPAASVSAGVRK